MAISTTRRRLIVVGNWRMNGDKSLVELMQDQLGQADLQHLDVIICPPFPYLGLFNNSVLLGAQNLSCFENGAHTGEVSASMLQEFCCRYVIVGHSERRASNNESNHDVALKVAAALKQQLVPILCVGETESVRQSGELFSYLSAQLDAVLAVVGIESFSKMILAYEPIWAIGTGQSATPEQAQEVHHFLREHLAKLDKQIAAGINILYGGSVKGCNAKELFSQQDVDGGLIGGASLDPTDFLSICLAAKQ